jgi:hypothetical protein
MRDPDRATKPAPRQATKPATDSGKAAGAVLAAVLVLGGAAGVAALDRARAGRETQARLDRLAGQGGAAGGGLRCSHPPGAEVIGGPVGLLASWRTVAGCGAGASSSTGGGVKWIGRNVSGGLFRVECQANYIDTPNGPSYVGTALVSADLGERWTLGVSVPYLYKMIYDPYGLGFDVHNRGLGDVNALVTRKFGAIEQLSATLALGAPSGSHDATLVRDTSVLLAQDRQLGLGKPTASLMLDHVLDNDWGPTVLGGLASWRGGTNDLQSYRAPTASLYAFTSYLLGPFAPAIGLQASGFSRHDRDRGVEQASPLFSVAGNVSLEWSTDWLALLIGASFPYQYDGLRTDADGRPRNPWGFGPWVIAAGFAFSP